MSQFSVKSSSRFSFGQESARHDYVGEIATLQSARQPAEGHTVKLANLYMELALEKQAAKDLNAATKAFSDAIGVLKEARASSASPEIAHLYAMAVMSWANVQHELGDLQAALAGYIEAAEALTSLESQGNGEAKFDLAGIRFDRGLVYHTFGDFEKASADFEASFLAFRALEKISDLNDTRLLMAKVSVAQGRLARDRGEPLETIEAFYNRAMRLLVELIEGGSLTLEHDLAVALVERCIAQFDARLASGKPTPESASVLDPVLTDLQHAIDILERQSRAESPAVVNDLFCALFTRGTMLLDLGRYGESESVLAVILQRFSAIVQSTSPPTMSRVAGVYENLAMAVFQQTRYAAALGPLTQGVEIRERLLAEYADTLHDELVDYVCDLAMSYLNRIAMRKALRDSSGMQSDAHLLRQLAAFYLGAYPEDARQIESRLTELLA